MKACNARGAGTCEVIGCLHKCPKARFAWSTAVCTCCVQRLSCDELLFLCVSGHGTDSERSQALRRVMDRLGREPGLLERTLRVRTGLLAAVGAELAAEANELAGAAEKS